MNIHEFLANAVDTPFFDLIECPNGQADGLEASRFVLSELLDQVIHHFLPLLLFCPTWKFLGGENHVNSSPILVDADQDLRLPGFPTTVGGKSIKRLSDPTKRLPYF